MHRAAKELKQRDSSDEHLQATSTATSFLKFSAVLLILRNAIGVQQVPSNMVLYGIAMVMSLLVMGPVLTDAGSRFAPGGQMPETGTEVLTCFNHHVTDFIEAANASGFQLLQLDEQFDEGDRSQLPRILNLLFEKL